MSRITFTAIASATGATAEVYAQVRKIAGGTVPNLFAAVGHVAPETLSAVLTAEGVLAVGSLSKQDLETIKLLVSEQTGCDYCVAAHQMLGKMTGLSTEALKQIRAGLLHVFIQHTSASLSINENADPDVPADLESSFNAIAPEDFPYRHTCEGLDDMPAHVRAALTQVHLSIPVVEGRLVLGTWQGLYLFEHRRRPHRR